MLEAFRFQNFKSYRDATLPLGPLTVLVGANASGKSNAIEGICTLSWLARGQKLSAVQYAEGPAGQNVRGRIQDMSYREGGEFTLSCDLNETLCKGWNKLSISISSQDEELRIIGESITGKQHESPLYRLIDRSKGIIPGVMVSYNRFSLPVDPPPITCDYQSALFTQLDSPARFADLYWEAQEIIPLVSKSFQRLLSSVLFLDPIPSQMRGYSARFLSDKILRGNATNISAVLYYLWWDPAREECNRKEILEFIRSLPEQDISSLDFIKTPRNEVMLELEETFGGTTRKFDASLLSDGTLRVLAVAAAMLSAPEQSVVVIEEIDNGVHPSRAHHLLENIRRIAERRNLRVLLTTHNPAMLDALPDAAVPDVVFCYRDPEDGSSRLLRLQDFPDYPELIAQGRLGYLTTSGILDRAVKSYQGPEVKRQKASEWLRRLEAQIAGDAA